MGANKPQSTREEILKGFVPLGKTFDLFHNLVLVAVYIRPEKTASGVFLSDTTRDEDKWQGNAGMVVAKGPAAFLDDENNQFYGRNIEVGDWVTFRVSDGYSLLVNGLQCRMLEDVHVRGKIPHPEVVY